MKKVLLVLFLVTFSLSLYSQQYSLKGKVLDFRKKDALPSANVVLTKQDDPKKMGAYTDKNGNFEIKNLSPARYTLKISYVGYKSTERSIQIRNSDLLLGDILLQSDSVVLKEVTATGILPIAEQKDDTIQFIASSYKVNKDANTDELVQKMPGVTVEQGTVKAQGENVRQVFVDGRQYFGEDPMAALRNLPAEVVDKVQVYDRQSEQSQFTGFDDGQTTKVMNVITKQRSRTSQFGRFNGGYGYEDKYTTSGSYSSFNNIQRISLTAQSNNINNQNFSMDDMLGVSGGGGGRGGMGGMARMGGEGMRVMRQGGMGREVSGGGGGGRSAGGGMGDFMVNQQSGISTTHAFGINYSDNWADNIQFTGSYFFNYSNNNNDKNLERTYLETSGLDQTYFEKSGSETKNTNHRANFRFEYNIDSTTRLLIQPSLRSQFNNGNSLTDAKTLSKGLLSNSSLNDYLSDLKSYNLNNEITFNKRFVSSGRSISVAINTSYNNRTGDNNTNANNLYYGVSTISDSLLQNALLDVKGYRLSSNFLYTEPLSTTNFLQLSYNISYNLNESDRKNYDIINQNHLLNDSLSNVFNNYIWTHRAGLSYGYQTKEMRLSFGIAYNQSKYDNAQEFPYSYNMDRIYRSFLPNASLRYNYSQRESIQLMYSAQTSIPSIDQLQDVVDNSNPLQLSTGNSKLKEGMSHMVNLRYNTVSTDLTGTFFAMLMGRTSTNYIGRNTIFADRDTTIDNIFLYRGTQLSRPENLDNFMNIMCFSSYGSSVSWMKSNLNFNGMLSYSKTPNSINSITNFSYSKSANFGIALSSNMSEDFDFTLSSNYTYSIITGSGTTTGNTNYSNINNRLRLNYTFLGGFVFQTNGSYQYFYGISGNYDPKNFVVNFSIARKFLSNNQAEIRFSVNDAFNTNTSVQRNSTEFYVEDVTTNIMKRYYLMTFSYNLRAFGN